MRWLATAALCLLLAAGSAPAIAAKPGIPLYGTMVELHFTGPGGKTRTVTEKVYIGAAQDCSAISDPFILERHPELKGWTFTGSSCKGGPGANIRRPGGPASVVLLFLVDGQVKKTITDHIGSTAFDMSTCGFDLPKYEASLVSEVQHQFPDGKFVGAHCIPKPKYTSTFMNSN